MSDLVFWQEPDDNYVRVGELKDVRREIRAFPTENRSEPSNFEYYEIVVDVRRYGRTETVDLNLIKAAA